MKTNRYTTSLLGLIFILCLHLTYGNNVEVTNVAYTEDSADDYISIACDISWENSWREDATATSKRDAIWLFMKYSSDGGESWHTVHLTTSSATSGYSLAYTCGFADPAGIITDPDGRTADPSNPCIGLFFYRSENRVGSGTFSKTIDELRWNYKEQELDDGDLVQIKVFAIEMVYVPEAPFYIGSGPSLYPYGSFYTYNAADTSLKEPYHIASEAEIIVGTNTGNIYYNDGTTVDDPWTRIGDKAGPIPTAYPKGYRSFYCMKYELTQGQYADFLNTLTPTQDARRYYPSTSSRYTLNIGSQGNRSASAPDRACNFLTWEDCCAYLDWSGLRPMTELEFEKACRGPVYPVDMESAWGDTTIHIGVTVSNDGTSTETPDAGNCNVGESAPQGPFRVGSYANATSTRSSSGASYYGIMELSGNLWDRVVSVGYDRGRNFAGSHGDGKLTTSGHADNNDWPGYNTDSLKVACFKTGGSEAKGQGFRGGTFTQNRMSTRVSFRDYAAYNSDKHAWNLGIRGVRTVIE